jgi:amino acid adenylation domain-containing protein
MLAEAEYTSSWSDADLEQSITARFERQVACAPDRPAVRSRRHTLTFDGLDHWANRIARSVLAIRGVRLEPVALLLGDRVTAIAGILAAFKAGKISLFLDPSLPKDRLRYLLDDSGAGSVVSGKEALPLARSLASEAGLPLIDVEASDSTASEERPGLYVAPDTPAYILYTSGSTGQPKGVVYSHRNVLRGCRMSSQRNGMSETDRVLLVASPGSAQGHYGIFQALFNGGALYPFDIELEGLPALRDWIAEERITVYHSVPSVFRSLAKTFRPGESLSSVRLVRLGGDTVRREDVELFQRSFSEPAQLRIGYACTETGSITTHFISTTTPLEDGPVPVGRPGEGVEVLLVDESGQEVGTNEVGEITVRSDRLALGYWRRDELTREQFLSDPAGGPKKTYRTGDLGRFRPDGLLVHLGRKDFQLKIRGNRVEAGEVEAALRAHPGVEDAAVVARPGPGGENRLVGFVVWKESPVSTRRLRHELSRSLPDHMVPAAFVSLPRLPTTARGKIDRAALTAPELESPAEENGEFTGARDDVERQLTEIWEKLLGGRQLDVRSDFFEMGGDSLLAVELFAQIEAQMGRFLPLSLFAGASTIESLAARLREKAPERWPSLIPIQPLGSKSPFYCVSWAEGEVLSYAPLAARLGSGRPFFGLRRERLGDGRPRHTGVEEMAAQYIAEIRAFQPNGPYHVGGLSAGGGIAFEIARQLAADGQEVGALVLMEPALPIGDHGDPKNPNKEVRLSRTRLLVENASWYWRKWSLFDGAERVSVVRRKAVKALRWLRKAETPFRSLSEPLTDSSVVTSELVSMAEQTRVQRYTPKVYPGRATLFLASHRRSRRDLRQIWRRLVPAGLEIRVVPGFHESIIQEPFVRILAPLVAECLEKADPAPVEASASAASGCPSPTPAPPSSSSSSVAR